MDSNDALNALGRRLASLESLAGEIRADFNTLMEGRNGVTPRSHEENAHSTTPNTTEAVATPQALPELSAVSILWWNARDKGTEPEFEMQVLAQKRKTKKDAKAFCSRLKTLLGTRATREEIIRDGIRAMLQGVFDLPEPDAPYIHVSMREGFRCYEYFQVPHAAKQLMLSTSFYSLKQRDERVRSVWLTVHTDYAILAYLDDEGTGSNADMDLASLKVDFKKVVAGGVRVARELGLAVTGERCHAPMKWAPPGEDPLNWEIRLNLY